MLSAALALDFEEVENIIRQEFSLDKAQPKFDSLAETQDYSNEASTDYHVIEEQILLPFLKNKRDNHVDKPNGEWPLWCSWLRS